MTYSVENIINIAILILLVVMIGYCFVLNKRLMAFRNIKQEMAGLIDQLNASTSNAQKAVIDLKNTVFEEEKKLAEKLAKASEMADELDMINQTGSNLADRIENGLLNNKTGAVDAKPARENVFGEVIEDTAGEKVTLSELTKDGDDNTAQTLRENLRNVR